MKVLLYIWQLPQNLLALFLLIIFKPIAKEKGKYCTYLWSKKMIGGISLGNYVILKLDATEKLKTHETGHCKTVTHVRLVLFNRSGVTINNSISFNQDENIKMANLLYSIS